MLKILRNKGVAKKLIWVIAIVIIISFGFFGTAYLLTDTLNASYAGKVFGKKIDFDIYNKAYRQVQIQTLLQYGDNYKNVEKYLNLDAKTWDRIILLHEAKKQKINVTNEEVITTIEAYPFFQRNGHFDSPLYNERLKFVFRMKAPEFEEGVRDLLMIEKVYEQKTADLTISEDEILKAYKKENEKAQISYVFVSPDPFKEEVSVSDEQIKQYYDENKDVFLMPSTINTAYLSIPLPEMIKEEPVANEETALLEEENLKEQSDEEKAAEKAKEEEKTKQKAEYAKQKNEIEDKADEVFSDLLVLKDINAVAKKYNLEIKTSGFFSKDQPNFSLGWSYDFLNNLFELKKDEIADPIESAKSIDIVQLKEKRVSYIPEFDEVKDKAKEAVLLIEAKKIATKKAEEHLKAIKEELDKTKIKDFVKIAKDLQLEIHQTPVFARGEYLPQIGLSKDFQETAFTLNEDNKISGVVETPKGYCILHLDNYVPIDEKDYEASKEMVNQNLLARKRTEAFGDFVNQLRIEADLYDKISELRKE